VQRFARPILEFLTHGDVAIHESVKQRSDADLIRRGRHAVQRRVRSSSLFRASLLAAFAAAATIAGCSSSAADDFYPIPDLTAIRAASLAADGSFAAGNEAAIFAMFDAQALAAQIIPGLTDVPSVVTPPAPSFIDPVAKLSYDFCRDLYLKESGSCACPDGGSMKWKLKETGSQTSPGGSGVFKITLSACTASGSQEDGTIFFENGNQPWVISYSSDDLIDYHTTLTGGGHTTNLDFGLEVTDSAQTMNVKVDDGHVSIEWDAHQGVGGSRYTVHARNGAYSCTRQYGGGGTCTGPSNDNRTF
jgi:hypothetical protein